MVEADSYEQQLFQGIAKAATLFSKFCKKYVHSQEERGGRDKKQKFQVKGCIYTKSVPLFNCCYIITVHYHVAFMLESSQQYPTFFSQSNHPFLEEGVIQR